MTGTYANLADSRRLSGGVGSISDSDFQDYLDYGNVAVESCTGLKDVDPSDPIYPMMETCSEYFVSALVRAHFGDKGGYSEKHYEMARKICEDIKNYGLEGSGSARSVSAGYYTAPLNPNGYYFSDRYVKVGDSVEE